jgi:protein-disulfide isomerase
MNEKHPPADDEMDIEQAKTNEADPSIAGGGRKKDLFLPISILAAAIMVGGAIVFATLYKAGTATAPAPTDGTATASTTVNATQVMALGPRDAILGNASATVTLIEYGDYQCPYCGEFYSETEPEIIQNYVNTGKVRMVFRNFAFLGPESTAAAEAADCAEDQNKLWVYHNALYSAKVADDASGGSEDDGFFSTAELLKLGQQVGLNMTTFTSCVDNNTDGNLVTQEQTAAAGVGVNSTPTFFINGQMITGAEPYTTFQQALDSAAQG